MKYKYFCFKNGFFFVYFVVKKFLVGIEFVLLMV